MATITVADFEELYRSTAPDLFAYLRRRTSIEVEDLVAEVFTVAWRRRAALPEPELRRAWLFGAARNLLLAESRRRRHGHEISEGLAAGHPADPQTVEDPVDERLSGVVAAALGRLDPEDRELIQLIEWEGLTPSEVAVALGIRPGTVRVRLHRARQALAADPGLSALVTSGMSAATPG